MIEVQEMPFNEKLEGILLMQSIVENFAPKLVKSEFNDQKLRELRNIWKDESEPISLEATDEEKYELAYKNFLQNWMSGKNFMQKYGGGLGVRNYVKAATNAWKSQYSNYEMPIKVLSRVSSKTAFKMLAKRLAYQLQIFSPFTVSELSDDKMVLEMTPCKIACTRSSNDFCLMACQNILPAWLQASYNVKMILNPQGKNCTAILTPFK